MKQIEHKRKIAFIANTMCVGGVERALLELLKNLDYNRFSVTLYLRNSEGELFSEIDKHVNIKYWGSVESDVKLFGLIKKCRLLSFIKGIWYRVLARLHSNDWALNELYAVKSIPCDAHEIYDCIIAYHGATVGALAVALYRLKGTKRIAWIHGRDPFPEADIQIFEKQYRKFDCIFCVSQSIKRVFADRYPTASDNTNINYNLIDKKRIVELSTFECPPFQESALLTVGRLASVKGQQLIPATVRLLVNAGYDIHWYLVGDGPLREEVESEIEKHGVADHVILLGTQTNPYPYINNCDIYVQPSFSEGWGLTVWEARILNKPIMTTPVPVFSEQITSGENGLIVDAMTPEALFEGIKTLLDHPEMCEKFVDNLKNEGYDNSKELNKLYDFIES